MKKIIFGLTSIALAMLLGACANSESTAEQAAAASCGTPTMDDTAREVDAACITGDKEQVRLEGVKVTGTQRLYVYFDATTGDGTKGWEFTFDAATNRIWVKNTVNGQFMSSQTFTLSTADTYCIDVHRGSEDPRHIIIWKGAAKCDATLTAGQWGSADFNSNDHAASGADYAARNIASAGTTIYSNSHSTGMTSCNGQNACFAGGNNPDTAQGGNKFFYKGPAGSLTKIQVKNHLSSGL
jgi:hypothetical protein